MTLYLLPNLLGQSRQWQDQLPSSVQHKVDQIDSFLAESPKGFFAFMSLWKKNTQTIPYAILNKRTLRQDFDFLAKPLMEGQTMGLLTDCGLPCIADPGALFVRYVKTKGIRVETIPGPCSISIALQLSGLYAQQFTFIGYLPHDTSKTMRLVREYEAFSKKTGAVIACIEAPHRNLETFEMLVSQLHPETWVSVQANLLCDAQISETKKASRWKKAPSIEKQPTIFLFQHEV